MKLWLVALVVGGAVLAYPVKAQVEMDLTQTKGETEGRLERLILDNEVSEVRWNNLIRYLVGRAVEKGVPATTLVLILAFPMVAAIIAASRHLIGLRGFGIFIPAVLSVAFVASGMGSGIVLLGVILLVATLGRVALRHLGLQYLPRMALLIWLVSVSVLGVIIVASETGLVQLAEVGIFPVLILILLSESFSEVQMTKSMRTAINLTTETILLALIAAGVLGLQTVQAWVVLNPEIAVVAVAVFDVFMGKYVGLRLKEYLKFKGLAEK